MRGRGLGERSVKNPGNTAQQHEGPRSAGVRQRGDFCIRSGFFELDKCFVEPAVCNFKAGDRFQFERIGYFCVDGETVENNLVLNRTLSLRDAWAKVKKQQKK